MVHGLVRDCPKLVGELHPLKNNDLTHHRKPINVLDLTTGSYHTVWWLCATCGEEWKTNIFNRFNSKGLGCQKCAVKETHKNRNPCTYKPIVKEIDSLAYYFPHLLVDWDYSKNTKLPKQYHRGSNNSIWWNCHNCNYSWEQTITHHVTYGKCPSCKQRPSDPYIDNLIEEMFS
tara:strand:+ start:1928 stop:2449 length:522 start_codon:yes stop_codon:yes gene_type:complete